MHRLEGKIALISGGARGQGAAEAELFIAEGAEVIVGDVLENEGKEFERVMREKDGNLRYVHLDVRSESDWGNVISNILSDHGRLDILVNNVGGTVGGRDFDSASDEDWLDTINLNLLSAVRLTRLVVPHMKDNTWGRIVNIASIWGREYGGAPSYMTSKAAVIAFSKHMAMTLKKLSVKLNHT